MGKKSKGLGDTIEKITEFTGIKKLVDSLNDGDCSPCQRRKEILNNIFPYDIPNPEIIPNEDELIEGIYVFTRNASTNINNDSILYKSGMKIKISKNDPLYNMFQSFYKTGILTKEY